MDKRLCVATAGTQKQWLVVVVVLLLLLLLLLLERDCAGFVFTDKVFGGSKSGFSSPL